MRKATVAALSSTRTGNRRVEYRDEYAWAQATQDMFVLPVEVTEESCNSLATYYVGSCSANKFGVSAAFPPGNFTLVPVSSTAQSHAGGPGDMPGWYQSAHDAYAIAAAALPLLSLQEAHALLRQCQDWAAWSARAHHAWNAWTHGDAPCVDDVVAALATPGTPGTPSITWEYERTHIGGRDVGPTYVSKRLIYPFVIQDGEMTDESVFVSAQTVGGVTLITLDTGKKEQDDAATRRHIRNECARISAERDFGADHPVLAACYSRSDWKHAIVEMRAFLGADVPSEEPYHKGLGSEFEWLWRLYARKFPLGYGDLRKVLQALQAPPAATCEVLEPLKKVKALA